MKVALIIPRNTSDTGRSFYDYKFYATFFLSRSYISYLLAVPTIASLTPDEYEVRVFDENIEDIDYTWDADLVGISVRTMFAGRAYEISDTYRKRGVTTVLGGIHPSMCPDEALEHCDSVVIGEAERVWPSLLRDARSGTLKPRYTAEEPADLQAGPPTERSSLSRERYISDILQTTKGCPFNCEFCSVHVFDGRTIRHKTVEQVLREVRDIADVPAKFKKKNAIFFADDNIIADKKFARELFTALKTYNVNWMCQASINISEEDELLQLMREAGCGAVFIGFESLSEENLADMQKRINRKFDYETAIRTIQSYGILVHSSFIIGYDHDSDSSFDELIAFIRKTRLLMPLINILTPFPGTKLFKRLEEEGRILHKDWNRYDTKNVVFTPLGVSPAELSAGYRRILRAIYSYDAIFDKLKYYWRMDFWKRNNADDPVKFIYRLLFALRLCSLLFSLDFRRSRFILKVLPWVFNRRVRVSTIVTLMAYNDFAYSL